MNTLSFIDSREKLSDPFRLSLNECYNAFKSCILSSEDDIELQCTSKDFANSNVEREPMFIIVDSSCVSNSSCEEKMLIDKRPSTKQYIVKKYTNKNNPTIDLPSTSRYCSNDNMAIQLKESESMDDMEANLLNEGVIPVNEANENESIVISYLRNRHTLCVEATILSSKKKTSLLESVTKMETILEGEQFNSFPPKSSKTERSTDR